MRTSIDLPDDLFRQLKILAADRRVTLKTLVERAVENEIARGGNQAPRRRLRFPILDSKEPGTLNLTNAEIEDLLT
jgi:predicted DNA-binding ribbon-helix-helix protein